MGNINAEPWTLDKLITRVQKDLDLEGETFYGPDLLTDAANSAITDIEQLVIDEYSDYLLTYHDYDMVADQEVLVVPDNIYFMRVRWLHFRNDGFNSNTNSTTDSYKFRKMPMEDVQFVSRNDAYRYRILNHQGIVPQVELFPPFRSEDAGQARVRLWYIRHFKRLSALSDVIDVPLPEYILSAMRIQVMKKEGNPMITDEYQNLKQQTLKLQKTLAYLSDDEEDTKLLPNLDSLADYGDHSYDTFGR